MKIRSFIRIGSILLIIAVILIMGFLIKPGKEEVKASNKGFAVVELFTSEGCSSCPAADAEIEKISQLYPDNVYALGFHVDYWNRLGWKDAFSDPAYSDRQRLYADHFKLEGVYTPQVVVNGKTQLVGADAPLLENAVNKGISDLVNQPIELSATATGTENVQVNYHLQAAANVLLNVALVQLLAQSDVKSDENGGRTLRHINIVRDFKTIALMDNSGAADMKLPKGLSVKDCKVIVYLQQKETSEVTAVAGALIK